MIAIFHIVRIITHQITSQWGLHAQWSMKVAKKVRNLCCKGCKIQEKWPFLGTFFSWSEGHETLKGLSFFSACWCAYTRDSAPGGMFMQIHASIARDEVMTFKVSSRNWVGFKRVTLRTVDRCYVCWYAGGYTSSCFHCKATGWRDSGPWNSWSGASSGEDVDEIE